MGAPERETELRQEQLRTTKRSSRFRPTNRPITESYPVVRLRLLVKESNVELKPRLKCPEQVRLRVLRELFLV